MPRYYDEYNRPLSHEEVFRRASAQLGTPQVFDERGELVPRQVILDDVGWRFGSTGARAAKAAEKATSITAGAIGCVLPIVAAPMVFVLMVNAYVYRPAFVLVMGLGVFYFLKLVRETPPRITSMMALVGTVGLAFWIMQHYLPYPDLVPATWQQWFIDEPNDPFPAIFFLPAFVWYFIMVRAAYAFVGDDGWIPMVGVLVLAGLPGAVIQGGWDPLVTRPAWSESLAQYLPETPLEKQIRKAEENLASFGTPVARQTPDAASGTPTPGPQPTPTPIVIQIGNSGGAPVYLFRSPKIRDQLSTPYPPGTLLTIARPEIVQGDGVEWLEVRTGDGALGYLPRQYAAPVQ